MNYKNYNIEETTPVDQQKEPSLAKLFVVRSYETRRQRLTWKVVVWTAFWIAAIVFIVIAYSQDYL